MPYLYKPKFFRKNRLNKKLIIFGLVAIIIAIAIVVIPKLNSNKQLICDKTTPQAKTDQASLIVSGQVFLVLADGPENAKVLFTPDKIYKGQVPKFGISIAALQDTAIKNASQNGELHFVADNQKYLLYLKAGVDGMFNTSKCFGSRVFGSGLSPEESAILGSGKKVMQS